MNQFDNAHTKIVLLESENKRLLTEYSSYRMAIEQAMDIYTAETAYPEDVARLMYDALGMVYTDDDAVSGRQSDD